MKSFNDYKEMLEQYCANYGLMRLITDLSGDVVNYVHSAEDETLYEQFDEMVEKRRKREFMQIVDFLCEISSQGTGVIMKEMEAVQMTEKALDAVPYTITDVDGAYDYGDKLSDELIERMEEWRCSVKS